MLGGLGSCASPPRLTDREINEQHHRQVIAERPNLLMTQRPVFRGLYYLELAEALQAMPRAESESQLKAWAESGNYEREVVILCVMLFINQDGGPLKRAFRLNFFGFSHAAVSITNGYGLGATKAEDWPDWPLAMVDGVPFLLAANFAAPYSGPWVHQTEPPPPLALNYLKYCVAEGHWTTHTYSTVNMAVRQQALDKLLKSPVWKRNLREGEIKYLNYQISDDAPGEPVYFFEDGRMDH